jgi:hypothetical protein
MEQNCVYRIESPKVISKVFEFADRFCVVRSYPKSNAQPVKLSDYWKDRDVEMVRLAAISEANMIVSLH